MAIEKMQLVNIVGNMPDLEPTLHLCVENGILHPEMAINTNDKTSGFSALTGDNIYAPALKELYDLAEDLRCTLAQSQDCGDMTVEQANVEIARIRGDIQTLSDEKRLLKESISMHEQAIALIGHVQGLDVPFDSIFQMNFVKVRFGRLPVDSFAKLNFYDNKTFFFFSFDHDDAFYWGAYFAPATKIAVIDDIFKSLYFERLRIPEYAHSKPDEAVANIKATLEEERKRLSEIRRLLSETTSKEQQVLNRCFTVLKSESDTFALHKYVAVVNNRFYLEGFAPEADSHKLSSALSIIDSVSCVLNPADANPRLQPPTKLKNGRFAKPFQMFVGMYGLPSYYDFDPTFLVALTYTLLFGIMFGDLGQGVVIAVIGAVMTFVKKMDFGRIMMRLGVSSMIFGFAYGSVFGLEHLLDPFWHSLGFPEKPIEVFNGDTTNMLLVAAIGLGATIIATSMCINIYLGFKYKNYERAIFGHNGLAGLVLYLGIVVAVALTMLTTLNVLNPVFISLVIVVPVFMIFFRDPLSKWVQRHKDLKAEGGIGNFIMENFFELFEYVLSYLSNTMSFLRVGGFILSHAGMMAVVMSLSEMMSGAGSVVTLILGNVFVMCLEGMIVGIQVLRLEFYEIFSRFYSGDGKDYEPAKVNYKSEK